MKKKLAIFGSLKFGTGDYIAHLYPHLKNLFDVEVISFSHMKYDDPVIPEESELVFKNIPSPKLLVRPTTFMTLAESYKKIFDFVKSFQPDVFNLQITALIRVLHYFFYPLINYLKSNKTKIIYTFHDILHIGEKNLVTNELLLPFYQLGDAAIVGNEMEEKRLKELFYFDKSIMVGRHGVYNLFDNNVIGVLEARSQFKFNKNDFVILFFGILRENKGLEELIQAFHILKTKNKAQQAKLLICTTLRDHFELKKYYEELVKKLDLEDRVKLDIRIKEVYILKQIETVFKASDVICLPYTHISQSGILNLAVGFHKPVIISDAFLEANEIKNKLGIVIPKKNSDKLAEAIENMENNYTSQLNLFNQNLKEYENLHNWQTLAQKMLQIIENI